MTTLTITRGVSGSVEFKPFVHDYDFFPNGEENRCLAKAGTGNRCKNPVLHGQAHTIRHNCNGEDTAIMKEKDFNTMLSGLCYIHSRIDTPAHVW